MAPGGEQRCGNFGGAFHQDVGIVAEVGPKGGYLSG